MRERKQRKVGTGTVYILEVVDSTRVDGSLEQTDSEISAIIGANGQTKSFVR
jgi:hypothetical protein